MAWRTCAGAASGARPPRTKRTSCACCRPRCWQAAMASRGRRWGVVQAEYGGETAFLFEPDGSLLAIVRNRAAALPARVCRAGAPYRAWTGTRAGPQHRRPAARPLGPQACWSAAGRPSRSNRAVTTLYWLVDDGLHEAAELPSAGDNSYPGFVELGLTRALAVLLLEPCRRRRRRIRHGRPGCAAPPVGDPSGRAQPARVNGEPRPWARASGRRLGTTVECAIRTSARYL